MTSLLVLADDLTGAADTGVAFAAAGLHTEIALAGGDGTPASGAPRVLCVDTDTRGHDARAAEAAVRRAVRDAGPVRWTYKKVDSTLRGHVAVEVRAALEETGSDIALVAPAFPATGRTTVGDWQYVDGEPLGASHVWRESAAGPAPDRITDLFAGTGLPAGAIALPDVQAGRDRVAADVRSAAARGRRVVVCDAATDAELAAVAEGGVACGELRLLWCGSGGLAPRLVDPFGLRGAAAPERTLPSPRRTGPLLAVVGSPTRRSGGQAAELVRAGFGELPLAATALLAGTRTEHLRVSAEVARMLGRGDTVVTVVDGGVLEERGVAARVAGTLGRILGAYVPRVSGLLLTGGETARAVLAACGARTLRLLGAVEPGVALSRADRLGDLPVVTKAGGFGDVGTLARAAGALRGDTRGCGGPAEAKGVR